MLTTNNAKIKDKAVLNTNRNIVKIIIIAIIVTIIDIIECVITLHLLSIAYFSIVLSLSFCLSSIVILFD